MTEKSLSNTAYRVKPASGIYTESVVCRILILWCHAVFGAGVTDVTGWTRTVVGTDVTDVTGWTRAVAGTDVTDCARAFTAKHWSICRRHRSSSSCRRSRATWRLHITAQCCHQHRRAGDTSCSKDHWRNSIVAVACLSSSTAFSSCVIWRVAVVWKKITDL